MSCDDSDDEVSEKQFKICLVGNSSSGKTSLANRYTNDTFTKNYTQTVGVEFCLKRTEIQGNRHITMKVLIRVLSILLEFRQLTEPILYFTLPNLLADLFFC